MAGLDISIANDLRQLIFYFLDNNLLHNALFLATRLQAREASTDATHILSLCYLSLNQLSAAAEHSESFAKAGQHLGCIYVFAQCCLGLGQFKNGIQALEQSKSLWSKNDNWGKHSETNRRTHPDAAVIYCLLGKLYQGNNDVKAAVEACSKALKLNPFMWDAFIHVCDTGVDIKISNIFKPSSNMLGSFLEPSSSGSHPSNISDTPSYGILGDCTSNQTRTKTSSNADPFSISTRHNLQLNTKEHKPLWHPAKALYDLSPNDNDTTNRGIIGTSTKTSSIPAAATIFQGHSLRTSRDDGGLVPAYTIPKPPRHMNQKVRAVGRESAGAQARIQQTLPKKGIASDTF